MREQSLDMLSTNAAGLRYKAEDLKNKVKFFRSGIFAIQETHFRKKGTFKVQDYHIFEAIRSSVLGIHVGLKPVLVKEYSDKFELIVVQIQAGNKEIRVMTGYGPQEHWSDNDRMPFYTALEEEISSAEYEGKSVIFASDINSKLGPTYIPGDPHEMSRNGRVLSGIIDRHALCVANGETEKRNGVITRVRNTISGSEKSVIDVVLLSSDLSEHLVNIHVDEERVHTLTKNIKTKAGNKHKESDHNVINTKLNIKWSSRKAKVTEVFKYKDEDAKKMFKIETTQTNELSRIIDMKKPIQVVTIRFYT
jgi:hypothetical protein